MKRKLLCILVMFLIILIPDSALIFAAEDGEEIVLHIMSTTDLHGQVTAYDYGAEQEFKGGGLSKVAGLVEERRAEYKNTLLFDIGDYLFDYTTDLLYDEDNEKTQPILTAMAALDYDAITVGNHDFDYGYDYLVKQLKKAGLYKKTVVSNVYYLESGEPVFMTSKMLLKTAERKNGQKTTLKIGIVGATQPKISAKAYTHKYTLKTKSMLSGVKEEAKHLKKRGADIIIALVHSGIGKENPKADDEDIAYSLTKLSNVDVVLAGHTHNRFPTSQSTDTAAYSLPNVKKRSGLVNGKPLVVAGNRGQAVGEITMVLNKDKTIKSSYADTTKITESRKEKENIKKYYEWADELLSLYNRELDIPITNQEPLTNYFSLLEDSELIQLVNNAKIHYAAQYVYQNLPQYRNLPIIAATKNIAYGKNGKEDYVVVDKRLSTAAVSKLLSYNTYAAIYRITGAQLKEWLEWSASAYEMPGVQGIWASPRASRYLTQHKNTDSLLTSQYRFNWSNYYLFDGIHFEFDLTQPARYNQAGAKISNGNRVKKVYYNGKVIKDTDYLLVACEMLNTSKTPLPRKSQNICNDSYRNLYRVLKKYIVEQGKLSQFTLKTDNNWSIAGKTRSFLFTSGKEALSLAKQKSWYQGHVNVNSEYAYLIGKTEKKEPGINLVLTQGNTAITHKDVDILLNISSYSPIKKIEYVKKEVLSVSDSEWAYGKDITSEEYFTVQENGIYTVRVTNEDGKKEVKSIKISNINKNKLEAPEVNFYTNQATELIGKCEPSVKVYAKTEEGEIYQKKADKEGDFIINLPPQPADSTVTVWIQDSNRSSRKVKVTVIRAGVDAPNHITINQKKGIISGIAAEGSSIAIYVPSENIVYIPEGLKKHYQMSALYAQKKGCKIKEVRITEKKNGNFLMYLNPIPIEYKGISIYGIGNYKTKVSGTELYTITAPVEFW